MSGAAGRVVHQDYIVRQRYSNALPPPPGAPKLLDIPVNGMETYTMPVYAERMLKAQPLNIEADAFLGMPIDLVGMPGIFEGDEGSIQAPLVTPSPHPKDKLLLRPLKSLGKGKNEMGEISFLRRTQYVAEDRTRIESGGRGPRGQIKRRKIDTSKEDPTHILRSAIKGFDVANPSSVYTGPDTETQIRGLTASLPETEAWKHPKHPSKPHLRVVDSYPLIPDLNSLTEDDTGGYAVIKFLGNPTEINHKFDERLETALLYSEEPDPDIQADYNARLVLHKANPTAHPAPQRPTVNLEFYMPDDEAQSRRMKRKRDVRDAEKDSAELYTDIDHHHPDGEEIPCFKLRNIRAYETGLQQLLVETPYQEVAIALHDREERDGDGGDDDGEEEGGDGMQKAAYFYPVVAKSQLKARRAVAMPQLGLGSQVEAAGRRNIELFVRYRDPDEEDLAHRDEILERLDAKGVDVAVDA